MTNTCELLQSVKTSVIEKGIIRKNYSDGEGKCCVVGYALLDMGMDASELVQLLGSGIGNIFRFEQVPSNSQIIPIAITKIPATIWNKAHSLVVGSGIMAKDWGRLQDANDSYSTDKVLELLDEIIVKNNC